MILHKTVIAFFTLLLFMSCSNQKCQDGIQGTFKDLTGLDGCGMVIELDNKKNVIPVNLDEFDLDVSEGTKVILHYTIQEDMMSICMAGTLVKIDCILIK